MNDLALLSIGLGLGLALALVAILCAAMFWTTWKQREQTRIAQKFLTHLLEQNTQAIAALRGDVAAALSRLDAERLYSASINLQRLVKSLALQVDTLQRTVFHQPAGPALDFSQAGMQAGTNLDEEAEDDTRMLREAGRWQPPPASPSNPNLPPADPLAGLPEEERAKRVLEYFERKRAAAAGFPYLAESFPSPSTPPAAGSGAYASLLDEASQRPQPSPSPADFSGMEPEEGVELVDKGELQ